MGPLSQSLRYSGYYGALFLALGVYLPFWPLWLGDRGLEAAEIGLVLALASWIKVLSTPLLGRLADRSGNVRLTIVLLAGASAASFAAFWAAEGFWPLLAIQLTWAFLFNALVPLGESQAMAAVTRSGLDYGRMRLWGSLTFILGVLGAGQVLAGRGSEPVFWMIRAALGATFLSALALPRGGAVPAAEASAARMSALIRDRRFLLFLAAAGLLQASHAVYYGFSAIHWRAAGYGEDAIGWLWAEGVVAEILLFAAGGAVLRRCQPLTLLALAGLGGLIRWAVLGLTTDLEFLIAAQALHAASFGAAHLGAMHFIARQAPPGLAATAQTLYAAVSGGLAMGLAMWLAGWLYAAYGAGAFAAMAVMSGLGLSLALWLRRQA